MFFIKIKVKGYLQNLTENTKELINTNGIKNSNNISYIQNEIKHKIINYNKNIDNKQITLLRENNEFKHIMFFEENKKHNSEYYLKESNYSLNFTILTTKLIIEKNKIDITYKILESDIICHYVLEMSDNL